MRKPANRILPVLLFLAIAAATCGKSPNGPGPAGPGATDRVEIRGPATLGPGDQARYTFVAIKSDGSTTDLSARASWSSSNPASFQIDATGLATGGPALGQATVRGVNGTRGATMSVVVTPPGTFMVSGGVLDRDVPSPVPGAIVTAGDASGTTGPDGGFRLFGVPADAVLQVKAESFAEHSQTLNLTAHADVLVRLKRLQPRMDIEGAHTMTVTAGGCVSGKYPALAATLRQRSYSAVVEVNQETSTTIVVTLKDAPFASGHGKTANSFTGRYLGDGLRFFLYGSEDFYYYYYTTLLPDVAEQLAEESFLVTSGQLDLALSGSTLSGTLVGSIRELASVPHGAVIGSCVGTHSVVFTR